MLSILLTLAFFIFISGIIGLILRKHLIVILVCLELLLVSVSFFFILFSWFLDDVKGLLFFLVILSVAAAESAVGIVLILLFYRLKNNIDLNILNSLKF